VRYIAARSLRKNAAFENFAYDFEDSPEELREAADRVQDWFLVRENESALAGRAELLLDQNGRVTAAVFRRLLGAQDKREVWLNE